MSQTYRLPAAAAAALLAMLTTACSDSPTAPAAAAPAATPSTMAEPSAARSGDEGALFQNYGRIRVSSPSGTLLKSTITFVNLGTGAQLVVEDNGSKDLDGMTGRVNAALPWSGGKVRAIAKLAAPYSSRGFIDKDLVIGQTDFGTLAVKVMPFVDATLRRSDTGALIGGGGLKVVRTFDGELQAQVLDNGPGDHNATIGRIKAYFDTDYQVRISEDPIPSLFQAPSNWTYLATVPFGSTRGIPSSTSVTWTHVPFAQPK